MKILIAYDGSECAEAALDDLSQAGLPGTGEVHILSVAEVWLPPPPPSSYEIIEEARIAHSPAELQRDFAKQQKNGTPTVSLLVLPDSVTALKDLYWVVSPRRWPHARIARLKLFAKVPSRPGRFP